MTWSKWSISMKECCQPGGVEPVTSWSLVGQASEPLRPAEQAYSTKLLISTCTHSFGSNWQQLLPFSTQQKAETAIQMISWSISTKIFWTCKPWIYSQTCYWRHLQYFLAERCVLAQNIFLIQGGQVQDVLFVLRFYCPVNPIRSLQVWPVYLTTLFLNRLSPLSS